AFNGKDYAAGSVIVIEADASCAAQARDVTELLEFRHNRGIEMRRGGKVHGVAGGDSPVLQHDGISTSVHADSSCPGCGVWLHENHMRQQGKTLDLHSHTGEEGTSRRE